MKKTITLALVLLASVTACKDTSVKQQKTETETTKTRDTKTKVTSEKEAHFHPHTDPHADPHTHIKTHSHDYLYKSDNGEIFDVTFFEMNLKMYIKIKRDNQDELLLDQTTAWSKGADYEKDNYKWTSKHNDATFSDGKKTMNLVVISPLQYTFTNNKEDIVIVYFSKNDKRYVSIQKDNKTQVTLEQTSAWAKGAEYGKDAIKWRGDGNKGVLIEDGVETEYRQKSQ